jgi:hypothetical protein
MWKAILLAVLTLTLATPASAQSDGYRERNAQIIHAVFGKYGHQAVKVAKCESGLSQWAVNGQYVNLFQMGHWERKTYGWHVRGSSPWIAARAAFNYFRASGYSWRAWACKPW